jgi:hypothetical protein
MNAQTAAVSVERAANGAVVLVVDNPDLMLPQRIELSAADALQFFGNGYAAALEASDNRLNALLDD